MAKQDDRIYTLKLPKEFLTLYKSVRNQHSQHTTLTLNQSILALDPGGTTGWATYQRKDAQIVVGQQLTEDIGQSYDWLHSLLGSGFDHVRAEDYRVYSWKANAHSWANLHTAQWIGAIKVAAHITNTPASFLMAQQAKQFWSDEKLDHFGLYPKGLRHGRDALRHLLYYILFPDKV